MGVLEFIVCGSGSDCQFVTLSCLCILLLYFYTMSVRPIVTYYQPLDFSQIIMMFGVGDFCPSYGTDVSVLNIGRVSVEPC